MDIGWGTHKKTKCKQPVQDNKGLENILMQIHELDFGQEEDKKHLKSSTRSGNKTSLA